MPPPDTAQKCPYAICTDTGLILSVDPLFERLLTMEWPRWRGPYIPAPMLEKLREGAGLQGRSIQVALMNVGQPHLMRISSRPMSEELTAREREVANAFVDGKTYKEVALDLNLSPNTVRHYLRNIYQKMGTQNKIGLARALAAQQ